MDKCRICLNKRRNLFYIYDTRNGRSFADMITYLSNVKLISENDLPDKICRLCKIKLIEAYDFKIEIERSDRLLQKSKKYKTVQFNNLNELRLKIDIKYVPKTKNEIDILPEENNFIYNNTLIKRIESHCEETLGSVKNETITEPLTVLEFLNNFKGESDCDAHENHSDLDEYNHQTEDYCPVLRNSFEHIPLSKRIKKAKQEKPKTSSDKRLMAERKRTMVLKYKSVHIKPVYLDNVYVKPHLEPKPKKITNREKPREMCYHCGKMTSAIKQHLLIHTGEKTHKCDSCDKKFYCANSLSKHKLIHTSQKDFKCNYCTAAFYNKGLLRSHMLRHNGERKFVCDICSKAFKRKSALSRHKMIHNMAYKSFKCDLCNMSFFYKSGLNHHLRVHTGERPYNCELCSQPYSYKHDFNRHCFKKHGIFLKQRPVNVMNEEVLQRERALMRDLMLKLQGHKNGDEPLNPFEGPQSVLAFEQAVKALESRKIPLDF